jgi:hypothetical protein
MRASDAQYVCHMRNPVIPANAGIHSVNLWQRAAVGLDSRFRGNDRRLEWMPIANDTSAQCAGFTQTFKRSKTR